MRVVSGCTLLVAVITASWAGEAPAQQGRRKAGNRPASRVEADRPPARGFAVMAARFGTDERWFDITQLIRSKISNGRLDDQPEQLPDPANGTHKALVIVYSLDGKVGLSLTRDDQPLVLPLREKGATHAVPRTGFAVLAAKFGHDDKWVDVTDALCAGPRPAVSSWLTRRAGS